MAQVERLAPVNYRRCGGWGSLLYTLLSVSWTHSLATASFARCRGRQGCVCRPEPGHQLGEVCVRVLRPKHMKDATRCGVAKELWAHKVAGNELARLLRMWYVCSIEASAAAARPSLSEPMAQPSSLGVRKRSLLSWKRKPALCS